MGLLLTLSPPVISCPACHPACVHSTPSPVLTTSDLTRQSLPGRFHLAALTPVPSATCWGREASLAGWVIGALGGGPECGEDQRGASERKRSHV